MADYDKMTVLSNLRDYYDEGIGYLGNKKDDRSKARAVWDMEFQNSVPANSIYYPKGRVYGGYLQRNIVKTFTTMPDIMTATPASRNASTNTALTAEIFTDILNARHRQRKGSDEKFLDDTSIQAIVDGPCIAKVSFDYEETPVFEQQIVANEETGLPEIVEIEVGTKISRTEFRREYVPTDHMLRDTGATRYDEVRWVMEIKDAKTPGELREMAVEMNLSKSAMASIETMIKGGEARDYTAETKTDDTNPSKAKDNELIEIVHFFGYLTYNEKGDYGFCRIITDSDFKHLLLFVAEDDEDADQYLYFWLDGRPMIPYVIGYIEPEEGEVDGKSLMSMCRPLQGEENSLRNNIRKNAELSLKQLFIINKGAGIDVQGIKNSDVGDYVYSSSGDTRQDISSIPYRDGSQPAYRDLDKTDLDWSMIFGATPLTMGLSEPSNPESPYAILQMSNAANQAVLAKIERFAKTFLEPLLMMELVLSLQFTPEEELEQWGIQLEGVTREDLMQDAEISIDVGTGATNELAKRQNYMTLYFLMQQKNRYLMQSGYALPPKDLWGPVKMLEKQMPSLGVRDVETYNSTEREVMEHTMRIQQQMQQAQQAQQAQAAQTMQQLAQDAQETGREAAMIAAGAGQQQRQPNLQGNI